MDYLSSLFHDERCHFTERRVRHIVCLPTEEEQQVKAFEELRESLDAAAPSEGPGHGEQSVGHRDAAGGTT